MGIESKLLISLLAFENFESYENLIKLANGKLSDDKSMLICKDSI